MNISELKSTLSSLPDEELIRMAGAMMGRKIGRCVDDGRYMWEEYEYGPVHEWNPLTSERDAFELVNFLQKQYGELFSLGFKCGYDSKDRSKLVWVAEYRWGIEIFDWDESRCRAIVKSSILAWEYWKEMGK